MIQRLTAVLCVFSTLFFMSGPKPADAALCFGNDHIFTLEIYGSGNPVSNALVTFYRNTDRTFKADNKLVAGTEDAEATSNSSGIVTMNLDEATYYATIITASFQELEIDVGVPEDGICGTHRVFLTPTGDGIVDPVTSTATIDRATIYADEESTAILTIQAYNTHGSVAPNISVDLSGDLSGLTIEKPKSVTDSTGRAKFYLQASQPGSAFLFPKLGPYSLPPVKITVLSGSASGTNSTVSRNLSSVSLSSVQGISDGVTPIVATVTVRNKSNIPVAGVDVSIRISEQDIILDPESKLTDLNGQATFSIKSSKIKTGFISFLAGGQALDARPAISFIPSITPGTPGGTTLPPRAPYEPGEAIPVGTLLKLPDDGNPSTQSDTTVYIVSSNGTRHPFTHSRIYFTWYTNFANVQIATEGALSALPLGEPVPFKAGTRLLKFSSDPKVYALTAERELRWLVSEAVAEAVYGSAWNTLVEEFPVSEFTLYAEGASIERFGDFDPTKEAADAASLDSLL